MIVANRPQFRSFGGTWETWCENKFSGDAENLTKCNAKPYGPLTLAPWTDVGALQRGIPKNSLLSTVVTAASAPATEEEAVYEPRATSASGEGLFGVPRMALYAGAAVLVVGVVAFSMTKKRKSLAGYRRKRRSRRSRR